MVVKQAAPYLEQFNQQRFELARRYSGKDDSIALPDDIPQEKRGEFEAEINALLNEEIEIGFKPIDPDLLGGNVTPMDMLVLGWLFHE
jgi:hypothetical protein